jgi:FAD:protein FMN transferase
MQVFHKSMMSMGTRFHMLLPDVGEELGDGVWQNIISGLDRIMGKLNRFDEQSLVGQVNAMAGEKPVEIDEELENILQACREMTKKTNGYFSFLSLSGLFKEKQIDNNTDDLRDIEIKEGQVFLPKGRNIDLGAVGKGYAMDHVKQILQAHQVRTAFISFGESSVLGLGTHPHGGHWPLGVLHPTNKSLIDMLPVVDQHVAISSSRSDNSHIINPKTGKKVCENRIVAVQGDCSMTCDMLATSVVAGFPTEEAKKEFEEFKILEFRY